MRSIGVRSPSGRGRSARNARGKPRAEDVVARVDAVRAAGETPLGGHLADGREAWPVVALAQPVDVVADRRHALLHAPRLQSADPNCQLVDATGVPPTPADCPDTSPRPRAASPGCLGGQRVVAPLATIAAAVPRCACIASAVAMRPLTSTSSSSAGSAGIPFDLPSTSTCAKVGFASDANAWSRCAGDRSEASSNDRRSALPSTATTSPRRSAQSCARRSSAFAGRPGRASGTAARTCRGSESRSAASGTRPAKARGACAAETAQTPSGQLGAVVGHR